MLTKKDQENFYLNLGKVIRNARLEMAVSQEQLAHHLDLSRVSVVNIEKGRQKVQVHTLLQMGKYLGKSIDHLLNSSINHEIDNAIGKEISSEKTREEIKELVRTISKKY